jgi:hypothetical protein
VVIGTHNDRKSTMRMLLRLLATGASTLNVERTETSPIVPHRHDDR